MKSSFYKALVSALLLGIFLIIPVSEALSQTEQPNLRIRAQSAVLMDALSGDILYEQNPRSRIPPASFSKILTLYLAYDALRAGTLKMDDQVTISNKASKTPGSKMFLRVGERVRVEDLLKGIAIVSGNDACIALAEHLSGTEEAFVSNMNEKAKLLELKDSLFKNSHGMPAGDQYTTPLDIALLAKRYIEDYPALTFHAATEFEYNGIRQQNRNTLLRRNIGVDGLMTGRLEESGYHLVATAKRDRQRMIAVVMGSATERQRGQEAQTLLEYGFKNFSTVEVIKNDTLFGPIKVVRGKLDKVQLVPAQETWVTVGKGKESSISIIVGPEFITAPVQKGQAVGKALIQGEGRVLKEIPLLASTDIPEGIHLPWKLVGGGILFLIFVGLAGFWWFRRSKRKRFRT